MTLAVQTPDGGCTATNDDPTFSNTTEAAAAFVDQETVSKTGWLYKRGGRTKAWKKRWFVLRRDHFAYYKDEKEYETRKVVNVDQLSGIKCTPGKKRATISFYIDEKEVHLQISRFEDAEQWAMALKNAIKLNSSSLPNSPTAVLTSSEIPRQNPTATKKPGLRSLATTDTTNSRGLSHALPFSDDEHSNAVFSDDDFLSPLSTSTTHDDHVTEPRAGDRPRYGRKLTDKVIIQGFLRRHHHSVTPSSEIWAVLRANGLYLYPDEREYRAHKIIPFEEMIDASDLLGAELATLSQSPKKKQKPKLKFQVITKDKAMIFSVEHEHEIDEWVGALKSRLERMEVDK